MGRFDQRPLGDLVACLDGVRRPVKAADRRPGPYPYYGASGIVDHVDGYLFDGSHLLVAEDGENLRTRKTPIAFMAGGQFWVNNHAHVVVGNDQADTRFLAYAVEALDVSGYITGSTQPKLTQQSLLRLPVVAPPIGEQRAIAEVLGALDDKIESNRRLIATGESILDADADCVVGSTLPLGEIAQVSREAVDPQKLGEAPVDHFSIPAFDAGRRPQRVAARAIKSGKTRVDDEAILLSRLNPRFPRLWHAVPEPGIPALCSTEFMVLRPVLGLTLSDVWLACSQATVRDEMVQRAAGTSGSHQRVRPNDVLAIEVVDPRGLAVGTRREAAELLDLAEAARRENATLAALRDALLPELLSGRLRVPEVERLAEAVT